MGSNGSVIPRFRQQIEEGGPVTVTDPNIIRYFMTIPEAVSLVLQAGSYAKGGEIFVLDMGQPVKIIDLAEKMIRMAGLKPYEDIEIIIVDDASTDHTKKIIQSFFTNLFKFTVLILAVFRLTNF